MPEPEEIASVAGVWVADDIAQSDGTAVSSWLDRTSSRNLAQATSSKQPLYRTTGVSTEPGVDFDGIDDLLVYAQGNALSIAGSGHVFAVFQIDSFAAHGSVWGSRDHLDTGEDLRGSVLTTGDVQFRQRANFAGADTYEVDANLATSTAYLVEWASDGSSYSCQVNGVSQSLIITGGSDTGDWFADVPGRDSFTVGGLKADIETSFLNGRVGTVVVVNGAISLNDREDFYEWVEVKYGIDLPTSGVEVPGAASGIGTAYTASTVIAPTASSPEATGTAFTPIIDIESMRWADSVGEAFNTTITVSPVVGHAPAIGTAFAATVSVGHTVEVSAEAVATGIAFAATIQITSSGIALGVGTAFPATTNVASTPSVEEARVPSRARTIPPILYSAYLGSPAFYHARLIED